MKRSADAGPRTRGLAARAAASTIAVALAVLLGLSPFTPAVRPASAPAAAFSAERALEHLQVIARTARPSGSAANEAARAYLAEELAALELEVQLDEFEGSSRWLRDGQSARMGNLLARRRGTDSTGAILLLAHLDSVAASPGAADDGVGLAAILEALRALASWPALRNDLVVAFTDGEEIGLLGARRLRTLGWLQGVALAFNFEARGSSGPVLMFETSSASAALVHAWQQAAPAPIGNSLMSSVYELMPNLSDFTVLREAGVDGLNFAFIGGYSAYHTPLDTVEALSPASLQHHGETILALVEAFGDRDLSQPLERGEAVYFDFLGRWSIHYGARTMWSLTWLATLAFLLLLWPRSSRASARGSARGSTRESARIGPALLAWLGTLGILVAATVSTHLLFQGLLGLSLGPAFLGPWRTLHDGFFFAAATLLSLGATSAGLAWLERRYGEQPLGWSLCFSWLVLLWGTSLALPGGHFVPAVPLLGGLVAQLHARHFATRAPRRTEVLNALCLLPALPLLAFCIHLLFQCMMLELGAAGIPFVVLTVGHAWPLLRHRPRLVASASAIGGLITLLIGAAVCASYQPPA